MVWWHVEHGCRPGALPDRLRTVPRTEPDARSEVTTVNTTLLCLSQNLGTTAAPRPKAGYRTALAPTIAGITTTAPWSAAVRKSMTVPAFHDRWPLCSTT